MTWFEELQGASADAGLLTLKFGALIDHLCDVDPWDGQGSDLRRIPWHLGRVAVELHPAVFAARGLYIWGAGPCALYVGKASRQDYYGRFGRYIWQERSQCNLARQYSAELRVAKLAGFPPEIREWYRQSSGSNTTVRLDGAVRFAEEGIDRVWFAFVAHPDIAEIEALEKRVIPAANRSMVDRGYRPLLNKLHMEKTRGRRKKA